MSPKRIDDSFNHLPPGMPRYRARRTIEGVCRRCFKVAVEEGYANCRSCLSYMQAYRESHKVKRVA